MVVFIDGKRALELVVGGEQFGVILCDLSLPAFSGLEFHQQLEKRSPENARKVVFLAGGALTPAEYEFLDRHPERRLEKPFSAQSLRDAIRRVVGSPQ